MERQELIEKMNNQPDTLDIQGAFKLLGESCKLTLERGDPNYNLVIVEEELAELIQQVSKLYRGKINTKEDIIGLEEEMADVIISLGYILILSDADTNDIVKIINAKLERLKNQIASSKIV